MGGLPAFVFFFIRVKYYSILYTITSVLSVDDAVTALTFNQLRVVVVIIIYLYDIYAEAHNT